MQIDYKSSQMVRLHLQILSWSLFCLLSFFHDVGLCGSAVNSESWKIQYTKLVLRYRLFVYFCQLCFSSYDCGICGFGDHFLTWQLFRKSHKSKQSPQDGFLQCVSWCLICSVGLSFHTLCKSKPPQSFPSWSRSVGPTLSIHREKILLAWFYHPQTSWVLVLHLN